MKDKPYEGFLWMQLHEGLQLARDSDLLALIPTRGMPNPILVHTALRAAWPADRHQQAPPGESPPDTYLARFRCRGLVRDGNGRIHEADDFAVLVHFPTDYLRRCDPFQTLRWVGPGNIWHPNISNVVPVICIGRLRAATPLVEILYQVWEIITFNKVTMREDDALNPEACVWARANTSRFPVDSRPLKRRRIHLNIEEVPHANPETPVR